MSICSEKLKERHSDGELCFGHDLRHPGRCFHCEQPTGDPQVWWIGVDEHGRCIHIVLHPACAIELAIRMLRDVHEIECRAEIGVALTPEAKT